MTKIREELNDTETKSTILRISKYRGWFFEKIKKIDKTSSKLIKKKRERNQINTIRNKRGEIITDITKIQRILRKDYEERHAKKFENLGEIDKFLEKYNVPKLKEATAESLSRQITADKIDQNLPAHKSHRLDGFIGEFYKTFKEELTPILHRQ